jgi:hypothetical protein
MTRKEIRTLASGLFHEGIEVEKLSDKAKAELREAVEVLLAVKTGE